MRCSCEFTAHEKRSWSAHNACTRGAVDHLPRNAAPLCARQVDAMIAEGRRAAERRASGSPPSTGLTGDAARAPVADDGA